MDLHKLKGFHAVARYGGFTSAARRLRLTQPTLSLQVKALEAELGTRLFERDPRGVKLTPEGELLYEKASRLLQTEAEIDAATPLVENLLNEQLFTAGEDEGDFSP